MVAFKENRYLCGPTGLDDFEVAAHEGMYSCIENRVI